MTMRIFLEADISNWCGEVFSCHDDGFNWQRRAPVTTTDQLLLQYAYVTSIGRYDKYGANFVPPFNFHTLLRPHLMNIAYKACTHIGAI